MKNLTQVWNQLTNFNESPILNGAKTTASAVQSKAGKATVTATLMVGSTALAIGIAPVNINVAGNQLTNIEPAAAIGLGDVIYDNWNLIVTHMCSPHNRTVWMGSIPRWQVD